MPSFWTGLATGIGEQAKKRSTEASELRKLGAVSEADKQKEILKGLIEGNLRPSGAGETPIVSDPARQVAPANIGQRLAQALHLQQPQTESGQGYVADNNIDKMKKVMENALLTKEYETAMGGGIKPTTTPTEAPSASSEATTPSPTPTPSSKGKPQPFIQVQAGTDKYGNPEYKTVDNPDYKLYEKEQEKIIEYDVKKKQLKSDLVSFFAIDNKIDRATGGFLATRGAGLKSQYRAIAQPVDKTTGKPDVKGTAARVHDAATKRLRVQLVRAAGDVGNINIVEQEAAEKLIPGFYDSDSSAKLKRAYLIEISKAVENEDVNAVKAILDKAGVGYIENTSPENPPDTSGNVANQRPGTSPEIDQKYENFKKFMGGK